MAAAPFKVVTVWKTSRGRVFTQRASASDVADADLVFQNGSGLLTLPADEGIVYMTDIQLTASGTDTTFMDVFANNRATGEQVQNGLNLAANLSRQYLGAPIPFKAGATVNFTQRA